MKIKPQLSLKGNSLFKFGHPTSDFQTAPTIPTTSSITITTTGFINNLNPEKPCYQGTDSSKRTKRDRF